jgi:hypothetical protein
MLNCENCGRSFRAKKAHQAHMKLCDSSTNSGESPYTYEEETVQYSSKRSPGKTSGFWDGLGKVFPFVLLFWLNDMAYNATAFKIRGSHWMTYLPVVSTLIAILEMVPINMKPQRRLALALIVIVVLGASLNNRYNITTKVTTWVKTTYQVVKGATEWSYWALDKGATWGYWFVDSNPLEVIV